MAMISPRQLAASNENFRASALSGCPRPKSIIAHAQRIAGQGRAARRPYKTLEIRLSTASSGSVDHHDRQVARAGSPMITIVRKATN